MASNLKSTQATNKDTVMTPDGANDLVPIFGDYTITAAFVVNDIVEMLPLPANCTLVELTVDMPSLDSSTGVVWAAGLLSGTWGASGTRTMTSDYITGSTVGRSSTGGIQKCNVVGFSQVAPSTDDRSIGIKITTAATGTAATTGTIRATATIRAMRDGV